MANNPNLFIKVIPENSPGKYPPASDTAANPKDLENATTQRLRGRIERIFFSSPKFTAGKIRTFKNEIIPFSGKISVNADDQVVLVGKFAIHEKYGYQFQVEAVELDLTLDKYGLENFLAKNKEIKNIGPAKAHLIVSKFGDNFETTLIERPEEIARVAKISLEDVQNLQKIWKRDKELNAISIWLASFGLTHHQIKTITEQFGNSTKAILERNPYLLIGLVDNFGFKRIDEIARKMGIPKEFPERISAGIIYSLKEELDQGHCWTEYITLINISNKLLIMDCLDSKQRIKQKLDELIMSGEITYKQMGNIFCLGLPSVMKTEDFLFTSLLTGQNSNPHFSDPESYEERINPQLNKQQREAVMNFIRNQKSLISGGAGTGKTYTITTILNICQEINLDVALAAPTGKAAKRMEQVTGFSASTVHRLLGWGEDFDDKGNPLFGYNERHPLPCDVVIIDEFSMMDIFLTQSLLKAVSGNTAVVFVGDHNQLPPVGAGNVLRDLILYQVIPTVILSQVIRQSGALKENSNAILQGIVAPSVYYPPGEVGVPVKVSPWVIEKQIEPDNILNRIGVLYYQELESLNFDILRDVQLLTPTHKGVLGTRNLNNCLQVLVQKKVYNKDIPPTPDGKRPVFYEGDKVIQTRNDYKIDIMNGAIGYINGFGQVELLDKNGHPTGKFKDVIYVDFGEFGEENLVAIDKNKNDLQLAYALTIHKSQGSEFPCVILIIHKSHTFQHHRNLFYTGVTRAHKTVRVLGDNWGVRNCAQVVKAENRRTFLSVTISKDIMERQRIQQYQQQQTSIPVSA